MLRCKSRPVAGHKRHSAVARRANSATCDQVAALDMRRVHGILAAWRLLENVYASTTVKFEYPKSRCLASVTDLIK